VREALARSDRDFLSEDDRGEPSDIVEALHFVLRRPAEVVGVLAMAGVSAAILFNALVMQSGTHPAPFFPSRNPARLATLPAHPSPAPPTADDMATVKGLQVALSLRGLYDGTPDGVAGPKTVAAIKSYQENAGLPVDGVASEGLLRQLLAAPASAAPASAAPPRNDAIAALITASTPSPPARRVLAVERALATLGYGPLKVDGQFDHDTQASIIRFERDRSLPVTGQISTRLTRELTAVSGIAVE
jgi:peptidoglycan hydrolase-like protein with peptidoglycan-binding domain